MADLQTHQPYTLDTAARTTAAAAAAPGAWVVLIMWWAAVVQLVPDRHGLLENVLHVINYYVQPKKHGAVLHRTIL